MRWRDRMDERGEFAEYGLLYLIACGLGIWLIGKVGVNRWLLLALSVLGPVALLAFVTVGSLIYMRSGRRLLARRAEEVRAYGVREDEALEYLRAKASPATVRAFRLLGIPANHLTTVVRMTTPERAAEWVGQGVPLNEVIFWGRFTDEQRVSFLPLVQAGAPPSRCKELLAQGLTPEQVRRWITAGFRIDPDVVRGLRTGITFDDAIAYRAAMPHLNWNESQTLPYLGHLKEAGFGPTAARHLPVRLPDTGVLVKMQRDLGTDPEATCMWARVEASSAVWAFDKWRQAKEWISALGPMACYYADAGLTLPEAVRAQQEHGDEAVLLLASLR